MNLAFELAYLEGLKNKFDALLPPFVCNQRGCKENVSYSNNVLTSAWLSGHMDKGLSLTITTRKSPNDPVKEDISTVCKKCA